MYWDPSSIRPRAIVGTAAVALILACGRWGSNLGNSPIFLTDILILLGLIGWFIASAKQGPREFSGWVPSRRPGVVFVIFFVFVCFRVAFSISNGPVLDWIRDAAPFLYGFLAFVSAVTLARSSPQARARTIKVFWWALSFHLLWMIGVTITGFTGLQTPIGEAPIFEVRPDIDAAILGVGAGMYLLHLFTTKKRFWAIAAFSASIACVLLMNSRAALLSLGVSLVLAFAIRYSTTPGRSSARTAMQLIVPVLVIVALVVLPTTAPGQRILATIDRSQASTDGQRNAQGTERARQLVWARVVEWTNEDTARQLVGSGFGNDFLTQSGTVQYLEGSTYDNVRSPHNWFIGIYARMGIVGLVLALLVCLQLVLLIIRNRKMLGDSPLLAVSGLIVVGFLPVATLGVVLEAPFGAVPFWWAAGVIFTLRKRRSGRGEPDQFIERPSDEISLRETRTAAKSGG